MITLLKKELAFYFNNPIGYLVGVLFAVFANFLFVKDLFLRGDSSMRYFFDFLPWLLLIFLPALTMRIFAEEKRTNTLEVLLTLPVNELSIVGAKFLALVIFAGLALGLTLSIPISLSFIGKPAVAEIAAAYIGAIIMSTAFLALSLFFSSVTKNQIVAFLSSALALFFLIMIGSEFGSSFIPGFVQPWLALLSPMLHFETFLRGLIDLRSLIYFASFTCLFLFLTVITLEKRD